MGMATAGLPDSAPAGMGAKLSPSTSISQPPAGSPCALQSNAGAVLWSISFCALATAGVGPSIFFEQPSRQVRSTMRRRVNGHLRIEQ